ncbi:alpha/beta-hydrolase [Linderina pennispora]|uniref:Alpha/beta-hydrolase n=1 Tax=Linderina pennispora TaxID=61395 RepID=A0A1Y1WML4_9FUNG|nr:alpha/beta-hydrolase [Linderina pennispora]ORX74800.1 alpha/beta-hydrolase [Linderina pennispora]
MNVARRVFDGARKGQRIVANVYQSSTPKPSGYSMTLLLSHANGFHKELWEPVLEQLFSAQSSRPWSISQAVAIDSYNHGDSAVLNRESVAIEEFSTWFNNASDILAVVRQLGVRQNVIGIGHSWGAASMLLAEEISPLTFSGLVIADPVLFNQVELNRNSAIVKMTMGRRAEWKDEEAARKYFEPHPFFKIWDKRILDLHIKHGLEEVGGKLVLKCRPINEAGVFAGAMIASPYATWNIWKVQCPTVFLTGETSQPVIKPINDCEHYVMKGRGHLLLHEDPDQTAQYFAKFFDGFATKLSPKANL